MNKKFTFLKVFLVITYALVLAFLLINIKQVYKVIENIFGVFMPFIYGFVLAYILSFPYNFLHDRCFKKIGAKRENLKKLKKPLSLIISYVLCFGVVGLLVGILIPELTKSITSLVADIPMYMQSIQTTANDFVVMVRERFGYDLYDEKTYNDVLSLLTGKDAQEVLKNFISDVFPTALNFAEGFTTGIYNWIIGIVVSIYMLATKDKLCRQTKACVVAFLPLKSSIKVLQITDLCNKKCGKFIIGKIIDSFIIGLICFVGLSIFKFDYSLLISVVVGVTNVIPFFGPFIGAIPCAFLLLLIDPIQCFWFVVFIIVLQQFDGNILGPKILGDTVGISGFWILFSVIVGGGLFGVPGMLLGVPVFAVIYTLIDDGVTKRLKEKRSAHSRINELSAELNALDADIIEQGSISESETVSDSDKK